MRGFLVALAIVCLCGASKASNTAFVYPGAELALSSGPVMGTVVAEGVLAPADAVLAMPGDVIVGLPGDYLKSATLVRLDKDLNLALLRLGEPVINPEAQKVHAKRTAELKKFLPTESIIDIATAPVSGMLESKLPAATGDKLMAITLDQKAIGSDVVHYKAALKKVRFSVELVSVSSEPLKSFVFRIRSSPKLVFVSRDRSLGASQKTRYDYEYKQGALASIKPGKKYRLLLEAQGVSAKDYEWYFEIESAGRLQREKVFVHFD
jgi:hypothetical protein